VDRETSLYDRTAAVSRLELGPNGRTSLGPGFFRSLLNPRERDGPDPARQQRAIERRKRVALARAVAQERKTLGEGDDDQHPHRVGAGEREQHPAARQQDPGSAAWTILRLDPGRIRLVRVDPHQVRPDQVGARSCDRLRPEGRRLAPSRLQVVLVCVG
jgi:hypothetical protein